MQPQTGWAGGKHGVSSYVGLSECLCVCVRGRAGKWICCQLCVHGKKQPFHMLALWAYDFKAGKSDIIHKILQFMLKKKQDSNDGCCWFWAISGICVFSHISLCVCFVLVACQGIPMQVRWLKIPFPGILSSMMAKIKNYRDQSDLFCLPTEPPSLHHLWPPHSCNLQHNYLTLEWVNE